MGYKALRNTYAIDSTSGVEVRRLVTAGSVFPPGYEPIESSDVESVEGTGPDPANIASGVQGASPDVGGGGELKGQALEDRIEELGGYEELGLSQDARADEKREAVAQAGR